MKLLIYILLRIPSNLSWWIILNPVWYLVVELPEIIDNIKYKITRYAKKGIKKRRQGKN